VLDNTGNAITGLPMDRFGRNDEFRRFGRILSRLRHDAVATATALD